MKSFGLIFAATMTLTTTAYAQSWQVRGNGSDMSAQGPNKARSAAISISCNSKSGLSAAMLGVPRGWRSARAGVRLVLQVDGQRFEAEVAGRSDYTALLMPKDRVRALIGAMIKGKSLTFGGPMVASVATPHRTFSLTGSGRALNRVSRACGFAAVAEPTRAATRSENFSGRYSAQRGNYRWSANIQPRSNGNYNVAIEVAARGCMGSLTAIGRLRGNQIITAPPEREDKCVLTISRSGNRISVKEDGWFLWHGASCDFQAEMTKR